MDEFVGLIILVVAVVGALPIAAFVIGLTAHTKIGRLRKDVHSLERQVAVLRRHRVEPKPEPRPITPAPTVAPVIEKIEEPPVVEEPAVEEPVEEPAVVEAPIAAEAPEPELEPEPAATPATPAKPKSAEHFGAWIFAAAGGVGLLVGGLLFFSYALDQGWLAFFGPGARFATGVAAGVAALVGSERLYRRELTVPSAALGGAGVGILYGALFAGHSLYDLFPNAAAFALMSGVTVASVLLAWRRNSQFLALLGLCGGLMTPVLLSTGHNRALALFAYLAVVNAGVLSTAVLRRWPVIVGLAGLGTLFLQIGWGVEYGAPDQLPFGLGAAAVFAAMAAAVTLSQRSSDMVSKVAAGVLAVQSMAVMPLLVPRDLVVWSGATIEAVLVDPGPVVWLIPLFLFAFTALLRHVSQKRDWPMLAGLGLGGVALASLIIAVGWESELDGLVAPMHSMHVVVTAMLLAPLFGWWLPGLTKPWEGGLQRELMLPVVLAGTGLLIGVAAAEGDGPPVLVGLGLAALGLVGVFSSSRGRGLSSVAGLGAAAVVAYMGLSGMADELRVTPIAPAIALVVVAVTAWPFLRRDGERTIPWIASALAGPVLYYPLQLAWEETLGTTAIGLLPLLLGAASLLAAVQVKRLLKGDDQKLAAYVIAATLFACIAVPVQLEGQWVVLGWSLEAAVLAWLARRLDHVGVKAFAVALAALACGRLLMDPTVLEWPAFVLPGLNELTLTYAVLGISLLLTARFLDEVEPFVPFPVTRILRLAAVFVFFLHLNFEIDIAFAGGMEPRWLDGSFANEMTRSLAWGGFGAALLTYGVRVDSKYTRLLAMGILMLAASKVFFIDLWDLAGMWRVGSVVGAALTLLGAAVLLQRVVLDRREVAA